MDDSILKKPHSSYLSPKGIINKARQNLLIQKEPTTTQTMQSIQRVRSLKQGSNPELQNRLNNTSSDLD